LDFFLNNFHISKGIVSLDLYSKEKVDSWKEILKKLSTIFRNFGFGEIKFLLKVDRSEKKENRRSLVGKKKKSLLLEKKAKLNRKELLESWKDRELFDFSIHTNFSTLDGIGKPTEYLESALEKGYQALAVTDHYNVQSFPEFSKLQDKGVKIIYGCEVEMIEDELPPYIFNNCEKVLCEDIKKGKYCFFDVETTGFFSSFNEIIEIGYIITENGEITKEKNFLICPSKEISEQNLEN
jgi:DNA polymerase III alpha subunit (gram-positive type)